MFKGHLISIIYFITALIFGALAWFQQDEGLDIAFNGNYIIVPKKVLWLVIGGLFVFFSLVALCFELFRKPMNKYLFATHHILTIVSLVIIYQSTQQQEVMPAPTPDYSVLDNVQAQPEEAIDWITYAVYMLLGAQIIFVINVIYSLVKSRRKSLQDSH